MKLFGISGFSHKINRFHLSGYSQLIFLLGILLLSGVWLFIGQQIKLDYNRTFEETSRETMNLTIFFEEHVRKVLENVDNDLLNIKLAYERDGISSPVFTTYAQSVMNDSRRNLIMIINEQGNVVEPFIQNVPPVSLADQEYFQIHRNTSTNTMYIGKSIVSETTGLRIIPLSRRINKPDGSFGGVVYIGLNLSYLFDFCNEIDLGLNHLITLSDTNGFNQIHRVGGNLTDGQNYIGGQLLANLQSGRSNATFRATNTPDGIARIISYRVIPNYPLLVIVGKWEQVALASYEQRKQNYILGASMRSLFILFFCSLLIHRYEKTRRLTAAIQQEKDRLAALINSISDEVWLADTNKIYTLANPAAHQAFSLDPTAMSIEQILSNLEILRADGSLHPVKEAPSLRALQGEVILNEEQIVRIPATDEWRIREITANPVRDANGGIIGAVAIVHDITERKAMEAELENHRHNLQALVDEQVREIYKINAEMTAIFASISDPLYILDKEWRLTYVNKEVVQMNVTLNQTHIGQNIWSLFPGLVETELYQKCYEASANNSPIHTLFNDIRMNKWFDAHLYPYENGLFIYFRDITEQKKYEEELTRLDKLNIIGEIGSWDCPRNPQSNDYGTRLFAAL